MQSIIKKWGNSLGIRIPLPLAKELHLENGSHVDISQKDNSIIIKPSENKSLDELLEQINDENLHSELDFGKPVGNEVW